MYQPDYIVYDIQFRAKTGKWTVGTTTHCLLLALAECQNYATREKSVPWRVVKRDLRPIDPRRDHRYLQPSVIWVSGPTFPEDVDYWKP
jgi:hypothetical protein